MNKFYPAMLLYTRKNIKEYPNLDKYIGCNYTGLFNQLTNLISATIIASNRNYKHLVIDAFGADNFKGYLVPISSILDLHETNKNFVKYNLDMLYIDRVTCGEDIKLISAIYKNEEELYSVDLTQNYIKIWKDNINKTVSDVLKDFDVEYRPNYKLYITLELYEAQKCNISLDNDDILFTIYHLKFDIWQDIDHPSRNPLWRCWYHPTSLSIDRFKIIAKSLVFKNEIHAAANYIIDKYTLNDKTTLSVHCRLEPDYVRLINASGQKKMLILYNNEIQSISSNNNHITNIYIASGEVLDEFFDEIKEVKLKINYISPNYKTLIISEHFNIKGNNINGLVDYLILSKLKGNTITYTGSAFSMWLEYITDCKCHKIKDVPRI